MNEKNTLTKVHNTYLQVLDSLDNDTIYLSYKKSNHQLVSIAYYQAWNRALKKFMELFIIDENIYFGALWKRSLPIFKDKGKKPGSRNKALQAHLYVLDEYPQRIEPINVFIKYLHDIDYENFPTSICNALNMFYGV